MTEYTLRSFSMDDMESLVHHANNAKIARFMTDQFPHPYEMGNAKSFIEFATSPQSASKIFAIDIDGNAVGGIGLHFQKDIYRNNVELGYWIGEDFWGKGIITKAIAEVIEYGFTYLPINRIFARPFGTNVASQKVLEKNGFIHEVTFEKTLIKDGVLEDEMIYSIRKPQ
jgi:RimJ/RimL family protein N-acetyltransferase